MFPLHTKSFPASASELERLLNESLQKILTIGGNPVRVSGRDYPALQKIAVNLDGAEVSLSPPPMRKIVGSRSPALQAQRFELQARGLAVGPAGVDLDLEARDVALEQGRDERDEIVLELASAEEGKLQVSIAVADLERVLSELAKQAAARQGVSIEEVQLDLREESERVLECEANIRARKMFLRATIRATAKLSIDDELNATLSNLQCTGEGAIGSLACGLLAPHLHKLEGRSFPLMALSLGAIRLREVRLSATKRLSVSAAFGA